LTPVFCCVLGYATCKKTITKAYAYDG